ncbi:MAG: threonine--tRNA ligase [bacterium]|nr:threonine--tRNA ligase [bacterium]
MKNQNLDAMRHSAAHLLAAAVKELWPKTKFGIGPAIESGFYYDFDLPVKLTEEDLLKIEQKMEEIKEKGLPITRSEAPLDEALGQMREAQQDYKLELIEQIKKTGDTRVEEDDLHNEKDDGRKKVDTVSFYALGDFTDLCRGPHVTSTDQIGHFKLLNIAGAYWRGSEKNPMLTRIYGTVWPTKEELETYLAEVEKAKENDHRKLGQKLDLFAFSDEIGPGLPLWLPKGTIIKEEVENFAKESEKKDGYQRVSTPHIAKESLYHTSGHLPYFADSMFPPMQTEEGNYYLKPMNCPHTHMIYKSRKRSYRELPLRFAEFGTVYRNEKSGELLGLLRVRGMTQNDAHIYATEEQVLEELVKVMKLHSFYYDIFGIRDYYVELALPSLRKKEKYFNNPDGWEKAIDLLRKAAQESGIDYTEKEGEAAFYGPKFDFNVKSAVGREFGASTNQLDFGSGERFNLQYTDKEGTDKTIPYIIHRAPLGSDERFIGILIEHFAGAFPVWLSPVQTVVLPITDRNTKYAQELLEKLQEAGIRADLDTRAETLQAKIRDAQLAKVPYMLIVGDREEKEGSVSLRLRRGEDLGKITVDKFLEQALKAIKSRSLDL